MTLMTYGAAIRNALDCALQADPDVYILGEDVAAFGGVFGITRGLFDKYGAKRIKNTPLSEAAILGEAVGAAIYGLKPIAEIQFSDFITAAMSPLVDIAANYHYRNSVSLPMVVRMPSGGGMRIGNFHSKCLEAWFMHVPGLKVVVPATPHDAKGLLLSSIKDPNPVLFLEQKNLYYSLKQDVSEDYYEEEIGKARVVLEGEDLSLITYGATLNLALKAARDAKTKGISIEVIDLRTLTPLDEVTTRASFKKTNRAIVLHEAVRRGGAGAEIAATLMENCFEDMAAPIIRVGAQYCPIPVSPKLEDVYLPSLEKLNQAIHKVMQY